MRSKESVGCLLIGEGGERMGALRERLGASGVATACCATPCAGDLLESAQMALYEVRSPLGACVAAEGAYWAVALALAVQLNVERVALIFPDDICPEPMRRPLDRLAGFARRNLFSACRTCSCSRAKAVDRRLTASAAGCAMRASGAYQFWIKNGRTVNNRRLRPSRAFWKPEFSLLHLRNRVKSV